MPVSGGNRFRAQLRRAAGPAGERLIGAALFAAGDIVATEAQHSITAGSVSGKGHEPSRPGQPPSNDTGVLTGNIEVVQKSPTLVEVSSNAPYSKPLEFGTSRMDARPFMAPALDKSRKAAVALVGKALAKVTNNG